MNAAQKLSPKSSRDMLAVLARENEVLAKNEESRARKEESRERKEESRERNKGYGARKEESRAEKLMLKLKFT